MKFEKCKEDRITNYPAVSELVVKAANLITSIVDCRYVVDKHSLYPTSGLNELTEACTLTISSIVNCLEGLFHFVQSIAVVIKALLESTYRLSTLGHPTDEGRINRVEFVIKKVGNTHDARHDDVFLCVLCRYCVTFCLTALHIQRSPTRRLFTLRRDLLLS